MLKEIKKKYRLQIGNFSCHSLRKTFGRQVYNMNNDNSELALVKLMEAIQSIPVYQLLKVTWVKGRRNY